MFSSKLKTGRNLYVLRKLSTAHAILREELNSKFTNPSTSNFKTYANPEQYWDDAADWYQTFFSKISGKIYETMVPFLNLEDAKSILETGSGIGLGAETFLEHASPEAKLHLTDYSKKFIEKCRERDFPRTEILKASPEALPFSGESFDRYVSLATVEEFENPKLILTEAFRVLKPNSILGLSIQGKRASNRIANVFDSIRSSLNIEKPLKLKKDFRNPSKIGQILKDCGFHRTVFFYEQCHYPSRDIQELKNFFLEEPTVKQALETGKAEQIHQIIEEHLDYALNQEETPMSYEALIIMGYK